VIPVCSRRCDSKPTIQKTTSRADRWRTPSMAAGTTTATSLRYRRSTLCTQARTSTNCMASHPAISTSTQGSCFRYVSFASTSCTGSSIYTSVTWWPMTWCCSRQTSRLIYRFCAATMTITTMMIR